MKAPILLVSLFCCSVLIGCGMQSAAVIEDHTAATQGSEYQTTSMVTLAFGRDIKVVATIETLRESIQAITGKRPRAKLLIRNLSSNKVIYEAECGDSTLSNPGFWIEKGTALVMTTKGGSGGGITVYEVSESDARVVLAQGYRAAAITMPNDELGGEVGFLIVDAEHATDSLEVKRYEYNKQKKQFVVTGKANFAEFVRSVRIQFKNVR